MPVTKDTGYINKDDGKKGYHRKKLLIKQLETNIHSVAPLSILGVCASVVFGEESCFTKQIV